MIYNTVYLNCYKLCGTIISRICEKLREILVPQRLLIALIYANSLRDKSKILYLTTCVRNRKCTYSECDFCPPGFCLGVIFLISLRHKSHLKIQAKCNKFLVKWHECPSLRSTAVQQWYSTYGTRVICDTSTKKLWHFAFIFSWHFWRKDV